MEEVIAIAIGVLAASGVRLIHAGLAQPQAATSPAVIGER